MRLIEEGVLKPGDRMPAEKHLGEQFGVGRTSVREALRSLAAMGVVETHAGDGTFVSASAARQVDRTFRLGLMLDSRVLEDLVETRLMLESHNAGCAAERATDEELKEMRAAIDGMSDALQDRESYLEWDLKFHLAIAKATQNSILLTMLGTTRGYLQTMIRETLETSPSEDSTRRARMSVKEHKRILKEIANRDSAGARKAMSTHLLSSSRDLKRRISARF